MSFQSKFNKIASTQARPPKSTIFPDHPHPTMLVEGGQEPGDGTGWRIRDTKRNNKNENIKYKTKQREFYQVGSEIKSLSFENLLPFDLHDIEQSFTLSLPDKFLLGPYDEVDVPRALRLNGLNTNCNMLHFFQKQQFSP